MKLIIYTLCYNESEIIPWVIDYWVHIKKQVDELKVLVFDNFSTDSSVEMLSKYDWIEVTQFKTEGHNDVVHAAIKNNIWHAAKGEYDFAILCDFDEILWSHNWKEELQKMKDGGYNVLATKWYAFCGDEKPEYTEGKYLHQLVKKGFKQYINHMPQFKDYGKFLLIDPNITQSTNFSVGSHILYDIKPVFKLYTSDKITAFHINKGFGAEYYANARRKMGENLSETNIRGGMGVEYLYPYDKLIEDYKANQAKSFDINNL